MKKKSYPLELKEQVVEMYLEGHSSSELARKYDISDHRRINHWVRKVKAGGYKALEDNRGRKSKGKTKKEKVTVEEENERLRLEVKYLKKLLDLKRG